ncbi:MAG: hypothetical protein A2Y00_03445 [Omnitrophica WOR_2 bacterium GWF2_43_52]|nr:MAG: hypothetical protein A2062_05180 [Omnitrophica WOR_2 bacterium GWA2_44_7]OGX15302.1 MAG: hypothetical protein A2Y01_00030 [Omnitrophica WOR_2 bacterium GWC2_44_8]OGX22489.1 MAG: hypothetical protein A2Y00_03445 [Omnitrophica WOR_2 bacterium GWF2_43_52]HBG64576.1 hypothetical protein [Candidatus Omnitrophota bacterium]HCD38105.1 hypothetical protein [Candidatus Omnitrophota bacterium]
MVTKAKAYALIVPRFEDVLHSFYASEIIKGVSLAASHLKADVLIHITERARHEDWLNWPVLNSSYLDGVLFADIDSDTATLKKFIAKGIPYLVLNNAFDEPINSISIDNEKAAVEAMQYLVKLGHKKIATIAGDLHTQSGKARLKGYKEALAKHKLPLKDEYIGVGGFLRTPARAAAEKLLHLHQRPTAIFAASDVMALELIDLARKEGLSIPHDISIIGFDDNPIALYSSIGLTTVRQPIVEMGQLGLETLDQIAQRKVKLPVKSTLPAKLVLRESCTKPKKEK